MKLLKIFLKIVAVLLKITIVISLINLVFSFLDDLLHRKMPDDGRYYVWKHGKVFYHTKGTGTPILLIHGFEPDQSGKDLDGLSNHLAARHKVYILDLLGFGFSDKPWFTYTNYLYVQLIQSFIKDIIGEKTHIVACGGSGLCVLQANKLDESLIGKIVLVDPVYEEPLPYRGSISNTKRKLIDLPVIGTFLFNLYSLKGKAPFDKEGRHVFTSRFGGYLTSSLTGQEDLITDQVTIMSSVAGDQEALIFDDAEPSFI